MILENIETGEKVETTVGNFKNDIHTIYKPNVEIMSRRTKASFKPYSFENGRVLDEYSEFLEEVAKEVTTQLKRMSAIFGDDYLLPKLPEGYTPQDRKPVNFLEIYLEGVGQILINVSLKEQVDRLIR